MLTAVEGLPLPGIGQPEVGAAVHDHGLLPQRPGDDGRLSVRQAEEDHVVTGQGVNGRVGQDTVGEREQVGLERTEPLTRVGARGHGTDLDVGVPEEQAQDLAPGISTGSGDGD